MEVLEDLSTLLNAYMKRADIGNTRLASRVNSIADNPYLIHRSTIRNWCDGSSKKVSNWRQLVTVSAALNLSETETNKLLGSGGCPPLSVLSVSSRDSDQRILAYWQQTTPRATASSDATTDVTNNSPIPPAAIDNNSVNNSSNRPKVKLLQVVSVRVIAIAFCLVVIFGIVTTGVPHLLSSDRTDTEAVVVDGVVVPVIRAIPLGRQYLIDLTAQPYDAAWAAGVSPKNCPELDIRHNYGDYQSDDLVPWDEGIAQCWVNTPLERLWIGFNLPSGGEGWLRLTSTGDAYLFREDEPVTPTLWASPESGSKIVGRFEYHELAGNASKVLLDFPESLDPTTAYENGDFHLGGCWQAADRDDFKGLHFYWPRNTEL